MTDAPTRFRAAQDIPNSDNEDEEMGDDEVPTKRRKVDAPSAVAVATKWSNPDPYTTLPPVDENRAKRTDVVQLIRKAKLGTAGAASSSNGIAENNDFVPLDFGSDGSDDEDDRNEYPFDASNGTSGIPFDAPLAQPASRSRPDSKKRKRSAPIPGGVVENWVPLSASQATPWLTVDHSATERMGFWCVVQFNSDLPNSSRLHKEICDFHNFIRPTESEELVRRGLLKRVQTCLERFKTGRLYCFGSFAAGLYLPNSDMDLVYVSRPFEEQGIPMYSNKSMLFGCLRRLESSGIVRRGTGVCIHKAKVPIIKFIDDLTGIKVDISFENLTGVVANGTYEKWKSEYPAMVYLTPIVKQFLMMRDLNEVFTGGLGGFSISCLVISFLQLHPAIQSGTIVAERHLGELLVDFLDLYGNKFNMDATGITLNPPGYFPKIPVRACPDLRRH
jgi:non-canonical poly(A) RNA polymerase PAPD5/7